MEAAIINIMKFKDSHPVAKNGSSKLNLILCTLAPFNNYKIPNLTGTQLYHQGRDLHPKQFCQIKKRLKYQ